MPPKQKVTADAILEKAFELTRANGFETLTARLLAKALNCSTQPIYQAYASMEELKMALYEKAKAFFAYAMMHDSCPDTPPYLCMGLTYVELAKTERHLFRLMSLSGSFKLSSLYDLAGKEDHPVVTEGVSPMPAAEAALRREIFTKVWIFAHGIACIVSTNATELPEGEVRALLIDAYLAFANRKEASHA